MIAARAFAAVGLALALVGCGGSEVTGGGGDLLVAKRLFIGVSCNRGNEIGCDGIAASVEVPSRPDFVTAVVAGYRIRMERVGGGSDGPFIYQGRLEAPRLLHRGPLAVEPGRNGKWLGRPPVRFPVTILAIDRGRGSYAERRFEDVSLGAGFG